MRGRLEQPPVKAACLAWRASKTRCNGQHPCENCVTRSRECVFRPSRRGGKPRATPAELAGHTPPSPNVDTFRSLFNEAYPTPAIDGSTSLFGIFDGQLRDEIVPNNAVEDTRTHRTEADVLDAYYIFIHPCFPVLPPAVAPHSHHRPRSTPDLQNQHLGELKSPLTLSIAALLAMIPSYGPRQELSDTSSSRELARTLSKSALQKVDDDMEMTSLPPRQSLHPDIPPFLEGILALFFSALYEYCHRGNINKTRKHLASAIAAAMDAGLHDSGPGAPEALRRSWWMITYFANQISIMHALPPLIKVNDPCLKTPYPHCESILGSWRSLVSAQFVHLGASAQTGIEGETETFEVLEGTLTSCVHEIDQPHTISLPQSSDVKAIDNWSAISRIAVHSARIKLYRAAAFADVPVFVDRHCDMAVIGIDQHRPNSSTSSKSIVETVSSSWSMLEQSDLAREEDLSRSCLSSALAVIRLFRKHTRSQKPALDYSLPNGQEAHQPAWPLTLPLLACSAMQACYVLVATLCRMRASTGLYNLSILETERATEEIRHGLETTMKIYSLYVERFAWVKAMYDELKGVYMVAFADDSL